MKFNTINQARRHLLDSGYVFVCFGAMTGCEMYRKDGQTVGVRHRGNSVVVA